MRRIRAGDAVFGIDGQVGDFVGRKLENDDRKAQFKDDLQRNERAEGVIVTLLGRGEFSGYKSDGDETGDACPAASQDRIGNGPV